MKNITLVQVTTFTAMYRHLVAQREGEAMERTLCGHRPVHLGGRVSSVQRHQAPVTPLLLQSLPECADCARFARLRGLTPTHARSALQGSAPANTVVAPSRERIQPSELPPRH